MFKVITVSIFPKKVDYKAVMKRFNLSKAQAYRVIKDGMYIESSQSGVRSAVYVESVDKNCVVSDELTYM